MLLLTKPSQDTISEFIARQSSMSLSYKNCGITKDGRYPAGYGVDHVEEDLGSGAVVFEIAVDALKKWKSFNIGWVEIYPADAAVQAGCVVAVLARHWFLWSLNACRILYVIDEVGPIVKFGFGYGTLPNHSETGEERFLLSWDQSTGVVTYDILAFSNPHHPLVWLLFPLARYFQNRFRRDSQNEMKRILSIEEN